MILLTNGDSFTEALTLPNQKSDRWSSLLSKQLGLCDTNIALGANSNARIFRTTLEWFNTQEQPDLVVIGWTLSARDELIYHRGTYLRMTAGSCLPDNKDMNDNLDHVRAFWCTELYNEYMITRNFIHHILHLQEYFHLRGIKYLFFQALGHNWIQEFLQETDVALEFADTAWQWRDKLTMPAIKSIHPEYTEMRNLVNKINLNNWVLHGTKTMQDYLVDHNCPVDQTGHFLKEGHAKWADRILTQL